MSLIKNFHLFSRSFTLQKMKFSLVILVVALAFVSTVSAAGYCGCNGGTSTYTTCNCALNAAYIPTPFSLPAGACKDPHGAVVQCLCPLDKCAPSDAFPLSSYVYCHYPYTGYGWNTTTNGFYFCTEVYRYAVCNGHGDVPIAGTVYVNADMPFVPNQFTPKCKCDAGWVDGPATGLYGFVQACSVSA